MPTSEWCEKNNNIIKIQESILNNDIRGIYGFFIEDKCVYIGKAKNIRGRVYDHLTILKWLCLKVELKSPPPIHIDKLKEAFDSGKSINVKVLKTVDYKYENYNRDLHHLAFIEYFYIEKYQRKGQCLYQYPEGSFDKKEKELWLKQRNSNKN